MTEPILVVDPPVSFSPEEWEAYIKELQKLPQTSQTREELREAFDKLERIRAGFYDLEKQAALQADRGGS